MPPEPSLPTETDAELELAFLQSREESELEALIGALVDRHAADLAELVCATLYWENVEVDKNELVGLLRRVFDQVRRSEAQYYGQTSLHSWLDRLAVLEIRRRLRRRRLFPGRGIRKQDDSQNGQSGRIEESDARPLALVLRSMSTEDRLALLLRCREGRSLEEISFILKETPSSVRNRLARGWDELASAGEGVPEAPHPKFAQWVREQREDGRENDRIRATRIEQHMESCEGCRRHYQSSQVLSQTLDDLLRPEQTSLSPAGTRELKAALRNLPRSTPSFVGRLNRVWLREAGWIVIALLVVAVVGSRLAGQTPQGGVPIYPPTAVPVQEARSERAPLIDPIATDPGTLVLNAAPGLSADGRWLAFSSSDPELVPGDHNEAPDVFLFDRQTGDLSLISRTANGVQADGWSDTPDVSGDGRWVAYTSPARNLAGGNIQTCARPGWPNWQVTGNCVNIILYDQEREAPILVTRGFDGDRVDGSSFQPTLSADGRWLTFWSQASNLVPDDHELCGSVNCIDIFVYDRETGEMSRVPIGREPNNAAGNESLGISQDGRWLTFTIYRSDLVAEDLGFVTSSEAVVYDRSTGTFEPVNLTEEGVLGDLGSSSPVLSADGNLVAFVSRANNLVPDDTNHRIDVFVRDRLAGKTERVSVASDGSEGDRDSGLSRYGISIWGEEIGLSSDGRFVVFGSTALDLFDAENACPPTSRICSNLLLHDRGTGKTEVVVTDPLSNRQYISPEISADGRWIAYSDQIFRCSTVCGQVWLKDRQENVTHRISEPETDPDRDYARSILQGTTPSWAQAPLMAGSYGAMRAAAFSPKGDLLAAGGDDGAVRIWRVDERQPPESLSGHQDVVTKVAFSPDGALLASVSLDRTVRIWRVDNGTLLTQLDGFPGKVSSLAFSPDGERLAVGTWRAVWIWRVQGEQLDLFEKLDFSGSDIHALAYSPDGGLLAVGPGDNTLWLRDTRSGEFVLRLGGHEGRIKQVAFAPDGSALATASEDKIVNSWQLTARPDGSWHADPRLGLVHGEWVTSLAYTPDGAQLLTASLDSYVRLWSMPDAGMMQTLARGRRDAVLSLAISPTGTELAIATVNVLQLWRKVPDPPPNVARPQFFQRMELDRYRVVEPLLPVHPIFEGMNPRSQPTTYNLLEVQGLVSFPIQTPAWLPPGFELAFARYDPIAKGQALDLIFRQKNPRQEDYYVLVLRVGQSASSYFAPPELGASARVEAAQVGDHYGEYVRGDWLSIYRSPLELIVPTMMDTLLWESGGFTQRLRWEEDGLILGLDYQLFDTIPGEPALTREDLIRIAESMRPLDG